MSWYQGIVGHLVIYRAERARSCWTDRVIFAKSRNYDIIIERRGLSRSFGRSRPANGFSFLFHVEKTSVFRFFHNSHPPYETWSQIKTKRGEASLREGTVANTRLRTGEITRNRKVGFRSSRSERGQSRPTVGSLKLYLRRGSRGGLRGWRKRRGSRLVRGAR